MLQHHDHHITISAPSLHATEHPMAIYNSSSVILPSSKFALIYLHLFTRATNSHRMIEEALDAYIAYKIIPVNCRSRAYLYCLSIVLHEVLVFQRIFCSDACVRVKGQHVQIPLSVQKFGYWVLTCSTSCALPTGVVRECFYSLVSQVNKNIL